MYLVFQKENNEVLSRIMCFDLQEPPREWCREQGNGGDVLLADFPGDWKHSLTAPGRPITALQMLSWKPWDLPRKSSVHMLGVHIPLWLLLPSLNTSVGRKGMGWGGNESVCGQPGEDPPCVPLAHLRAVSRSALWSLHCTEQSGMGVTRAVMAFLLATLALPHLGIGVNCPFMGWSHLSLLQLPHPQLQPFCASADPKTTEVAPNAPRVFTAVHKERRLGI